MELGFKRGFSKGTADAVMRKLAPYAAAGTCDGCRGVVAAAGWNVPGQRNYSPRGEMSETTTAPQLAACHKYQGNLHELLKR